MAEVGYKYKGEDIIFLVEIEDELGEQTLVRPFDQTDGGHNISADELEVSTKDRTGSDYGDVTETRSFEGELVVGDPFITAIKKAMRNRKFLKINKVNELIKELDRVRTRIKKFNLLYLRERLRTEL